MTRRTMGNHPTFSIISLMRHSWSNNINTLAILLRRSIYILCSRLVPLRHTVAVLAALALFCGVAQAQPFPQYIDDSPVATTPLSATDMLPVIQGTATRDAHKLAGTSIRTVVSSALTLYVNNVNGNDSNAGTSSNAPLRTIQAAVNKTCNTYFFTIAAQPTIQIQTTGSDYTENVVLCKYASANSWQGTSIFPGNDGYTFPIIQGNTGDATSIKLNPATGNAYTAVDVSTPWIIAYQTIAGAAASAAQIGIESDASSVVYGLGLNYGAMNSNSTQVAAVFNGFFEDLSGPFTVSGGAGTHISVANGGKYICQGNAVTVSGTPTFTQFMRGTLGGFMHQQACTYTGSITGNQYSFDSSVRYVPPGSGSVPGSAPTMITNGSLYPFGTFAQLPASPLTGTTQAITDGKASNCGDTSCTTFGTTITAGGGALPLLAWYNGSNWTLIGK